MDSAAVQMPDPNPCKTLGVFVEVLMPIGLFENVNGDALLQALMENGCKGHFAARIIHTHTRSEGNKPFFVVRIELLDNEYGRELLAYAQPNMRPAQQRSHCVAHLTGTYIDSHHITAVSFSCGPHGCGYVCDLRVVTP